MSGMAEKNEAHDRASDSDDDEDADYIPSGEEAGSEEDASGVESECEPDDSEVKPKKRRSDVAEPQRASVSAVCAGTTDVAAVSECDEKKKTDDLWSSFMSSVGDTTTARRSTAQRTSSTATTVAVAAGDSSMKKSATAAFGGDLNSRDAHKKSASPRVYSFAGEDVLVGASTPAATDSCSSSCSTSDSKAQLEGAASNTSERASEDSCSNVISSEMTPGPSKRPSGLSSVLGMIGKKPKISVLDKSKLDWDKYKDEENISEELQTFNRGKGGYIGRMEFLNRVDVRQFEIEKSLRSSTPSSSSAKRK